MVSSSPFTGGVAVAAGELSNLPAGLLSQCLLSVTAATGTPPKNPLFLALSILRI